MDRQILHTKKFYRYRVNIVVILAGIIVLSMSSYAKNISLYGSILNSNYTDTEKKEPLGQNQRSYSNTKDNSNILKDKDGRYINLGTSNDTFVRKINSKEISSEKTLNQNVTLPSQQSKYSTPKESNAYDAKNYVNNIFPNDSHQAFTDKELDKMSSRQLMDISRDKIAETRDQYNAVQDKIRDLMRLYENAQTKQERRAIKQQVNILSDTAVSKMRASAKYVQNMANAASMKARAEGKAEEARRAQDRPSQTKEKFSNPYKQVDSNPYKQ